MGGDCGDEVLGAGARGANVLGAELEDVFEVCGDVGEFPLEEEDDVLGVLGLLGCGGGVLHAGEGLEGGDLGVERGEVLLDYVGELVDLEGAVVEEGFALCDWGWG